MQELFETRDNQIWLKSFLNFPERVLSEVKDSEEATIEFLTEKFNRFKTKVETVFQKIDNTANKGSFLVQIKNFKEDVAKLQALGDFEPIFKQLEKYELEIEEMVAANRLRNLEVKKSLIEEAKIVAQSTQWKQASEELKSIYQRWQKVGAAEPGQAEQIQTEFQGIYDTFYAARSEHFKEKEKDADHYKDLISETKNIIGSDKTGGDIAKELKGLQKKWKTLPSIPRGLYQKLWKEFNSEQDKFFVDYKKEKSQEDLKKKESLVLEAQKLAQDPLEKSIEDIKKLRNDWRSTSFSEEEEAKNLWADFNYWIEKFVEQKRLEKLVAKVATDSSNDEKIIISEKIKHLKRLLRKEKENLEKMTSNLGAFRINHKSKGFEQVMDAKTQEQERKWKVKKDLIRELEEQL